MKFIEINNWNKFQHYKDRRPKWIKLLIDIIDEFDEDGYPKKFYNLSDSAKLTFVMLLCARANFNIHIPYQDDTQLGQMLGIEKINLKELENCNYINIVSKPYQDDTETTQGCTEGLPPETETEGEKDTEKEPATAGFFSNKNHPYFESIEKNCFKIIEMLAGNNTYNPFQMVQMHINQKYHPGAINKCLDAIIAQWETAIEVDPYKYIGKMIKRESQNFYERESIDDYEMVKSEFQKLIADLKNKKSPLIKKIAGIGTKVKYSTP